MEGTTFVITNYVCFVSEPSLALQSLPIVDSELRTAEELYSINKTIMKLIELIWVNNVRFFNVQLYFCAEFAFLRGLPSRTRTESFYSPQLTRFMLKILCITRAFKFSFEKSIQVFWESSFLVPFFLDEARLHNCRPGGTICDARHVFSLNSRIPEYKEMERYKLSNGGKRSYVGVFKRYFFSLFSSVPRTVTDVSFNEWGFPGLGKFELKQSSAGTFPFFPKRS